MKRALVLLLALLALGAHAQRVDPTLQAARDTDSVTILQQELRDAQARRDTATKSGDTQAVARADSDMQALLSELRRATAPGARPHAAQPATPPAPAAPKRVALTELERKLSSPVTIVRASGGTSQP